MCLSLPVPIYAFIFMIIKPLKHHLVLENDSNVFQKLFSLIVKSLNDPLKTMGNFILPSARIIHIMCMKTEEKHHGGRLEGWQTHIDWPHSLPGCGQIHFCKDPLLTTSSFSSPVALTNKGDCCSHGLQISIPCCGIHSFTPLVQIY